MKSPKKYKKLKRNLETFKNLEMYKVETYQEN